jgi:hypothetical protein
LGLLAVLLAAASTVQAQYTLSITPDPRVVEGDGGAGATLVGLSVSISGPNPAGTSVTWQTQGGTAQPGADFASVSPTVLTWAPFDTVPKNITVAVDGDSVQEWNTSQVDESFFVVLSNPVNAAIAKPSATVTILDDDHPSVNERPAVQVLSAVSDSVAPHGAADGRVRLQWRVAPAQVAPSNLMIRFNAGTSCTFPSSTTDGTLATNVAPAAAGLAQSYTHPSLTLGWSYCYVVFAQYAGGSTGAQIKGTPFAANNKVAWKFTSPMTILTPPTVGADAIYVTDTIGVVHALQRGVGGGIWPSTWNPVAVGPTNQRSAAVPRPEGWRLFLGTNAGGLHSVDGRTGNVVWSRNATAGNALPNLGGVQAQPAGIFTNFGGANDMLLVGTNTAPGANALYALDPATGKLLKSVGTPSMGAVYGMPVVDYAANRVSFLSSSASETAFAMDLGPPGSPDLTLSALPWNRMPAGTGANGALVQRNDRIYFGDNNDRLFTVWMDGTEYSMALGDGAIKGFVWPDRRNANLYFSTTNLVHGMRDTGIGFDDLFTPRLLVSPSMVLQRPGSDHIYVGDGSGNLVQIDVTTGAPVSQPLEPGIQIGAPSLDNQHGLVIVGSNTGNVYAVRVPF